MMTWIVASNGVDPVAAFLVLVVLGTWWANW